MLVYVINRHGKPLMPCKPQKARKLLKEQKAKVVKRTPFTIQLLYGSSGYKQDVILGVDAGSKTIGLLATTENKEVFSAEVELRTDTEVELKVKRNSSFRDAAFMGIMLWAFYNKLKELYSNVSLTFGYITKNVRIKHNLEKSHRIDARCISGNPSTKESDCWY
ncbi:MAG TPA: RRXRR domain-containing protein, partial [Mesotoga sp.]|nr:RRXRR domain-containing protein [Mesotoga sp.]